MKSDITFYPIVGSLEFLQEFLEHVFLGLGMKSLLGEEEVRSCHTRITAQKGSNF
jgi:hypothetical protein